MQQKLPPSGGSADLAPKRAVETLLRCVSFLRPYRRLVLGAYLLLVAIAARQLVTPQFIRWIVDRGIRGGDIRVLSGSIGVLLAITAIGGAMRYYQGRWRLSSCTCRFAAASIIMNCPTITPPTTPFSPATRPLDRGGRAESTIQPQEKPPNENLWP